MGLALEVRNLSIRFGRKTIIEDLSFEVESGTTLAILGPNGAGKTVLFKTLIGLLPHGGAITWPAGTRLGYVPQKLDIERNLPVTCRDFLSSMAKVSGVGRTDLPQALKKVGMDAGLLNTSIGTLSGGQFQRLLVACALIRNPTVLMLDEAAAGVDEPGQALLYELIQGIREQGCTVLFISHELNVVGRYADKVLCLAHGEAWFGAPKSSLAAEFLTKVYGQDIQFHSHDHSSH